MVARISVQLVASAAFVLRQATLGMSEHFRLNAKYLREMLRLAPATALGGLSYALTTQSESAIIAFATRPELVPVYTLTKRAAEMLRTLLDTIGYASYGSFAHLVHSEQKARARAVYAQIKSIRFVCAFSAAAAYIAVNASLVGVWVGAEMYGGTTLTVLFGLQLITVGGAYLVNYLYRATGSVLKGSVALILEALVRIPLMWACLELIGLPGMALAAIATSTVAYLLTERWTMNSLPEGAAPKRQFLLSFELRALVLCLAILIAVELYAPSWLVVVTVGGGVGLVALLTLSLADEELGELRETTFQSSLALIKRLRGQTAV
jgi:O-antigen/teichoic acid export membrane protein